MVSSTVIVGCIDIGSNTTRLLVAEAGEAGLRPLRGERAFTHPVRASAECERIVAEQAAVARAAGAEALVVVATAAVRDAPLRAQLVERLERAAGAPVRVVSPEEEARLAFLGATHGLAGDGGSVGVLDVGGGSTEIACGVPGTDPGWLATLPLGSGELTAECVRSDPPLTSELDEIRGYAAEALRGLAPPPVEAAYAVGGTATSLARLVGPELARSGLREAVDVLCALPADEAAEHFGLAPERVRLLPAGLVVLDELGAALGCPLAVARGGLREGALLELAEAG